jgi:hypothetical protein
MEGIVSYARFLFSLTFRSVFSTMSMRHFNIRMHDLSMISLDIH